MTLKHLLWLLTANLLVPVAHVRHILKVLHMTHSKSSGVALAQHSQKRAIVEFTPTKYDKWFTIPLHIFDGVILNLYILKNIATKISYGAREVWSLHTLAH